MTSARRQPETLDALLLAVAPSESWEAFAARSGVTSRAIRSLRKGAGKRPFRTTVTKLAAALGVSPERVMAAIDASRKAAER